MAVPADGSGSATRLTRSAKRESGVAFSGSGDILFVASRPDAAAEKDIEAAQLCVLPATGGEGTMTSGVRNRTFWRSTLRICLSRSERQPARAKGRRPTLRSYRARST